MLQRDAPDRVLSRVFCVLEGLMLGLTLTPILFTLLGWPGSTRPSLCLKPGLPCCAHRKPSRRPAPGPWSTSPRV